MSPSLKLALRLGRVSNLPTVWSNVLTGLALNDGLALTSFLVVAAAASLFYVSGMFLNDAFDRDWDALHRPERPIPAGQIEGSTVFVAGFGLMAAGLAVLGLGLPSRAPAVVALLLCGLIVAYNRWHKQNPWSPLLMGLCRVCLYVMAALAGGGSLSPAVLVAAALLLAYLVALSALAKKETVYPGVALAVGVLIAGISLVDALVLLVFGHPLAAILAASGFFATRAFQRQIAGT